MARNYDTIDDDLRRWIAEQKVFFVATAPVAADGHVNCSPKGGDTFRVLNGREVAYLDLTGSGIETIAHVQENRRILIMFCAFQGAPRILRLHGLGEIIYPSRPDYAEVARHFPALPGARAIIRVALTRITSSCGYGVPLFGFVGNRDTLDRWAETKGSEGLTAYRADKNSTSIDGITGYKGM